MLKNFYVMLIAIAALWMLPLSGAKPAKYIFLLIADGTGEEMMKLYLREYPASVFKTFKNKHLTSTLDASGSVSSSGACGTAIACGKQTTFCRIAMDQDEKPLRSLAYKFKELGFKIGIITDSSLTDATISPFFATASRCLDHNKIVADLCRSGFDFYAAGRLSIPNYASVENMRSILVSSGYRVIPGKKLRTMNPGERNFLFSPSRATERKPGTPSLGDITAAAANLLSHGNKGFFLAVSAGSIDYFNHRNDAASALRELHNFELAVRAALDFAARHAEETLIVITSDHEVGNFRVIGANATAFHLKQKYPYLAISDRLLLHLRQKYNDKQLISAALKMVQTKSFSTAEQRRLQSACRLFREKKKLKRYGGFNPLAVEVMRMRDKRNGAVYFSCDHTGNPVITSVRGTGVQHFNNLKESSDIPHCIAAAAGYPELLSR